MGTMDAVLTHSTMLCETPHTGLMERDSFEHAVKTYLPRLRRVAQRILHNTQDAEDALQDALLAAFAKISQFKGEAQITTWLTTIVLNSARMILRRQVAHKMISLDEPRGENNSGLEEFLYFSGATPEELYRKKEYRDVLQRAMHKLTPKTREAFRLVVLQGLSMREASQKMGVKEATIKARLFRARIDVTRLVRNSMRERRAPMSMVGGES